jgi:hypothetical protein
VTATVVTPIRVDEAYRALRVPFGTRFKLRWYARADRRAGLPIGLSPETTPVLQQLLAQFGDVSERERTRFFVTVEADAVRLASVTREIGLLREELARRTRGVDQFAAPPREEWLAVRYPGEERLQASAVRGRRSIRHWNAAERARAAQRETQRQLDDALVEQAELRRRVRARAQHAVARVLRFGRLIEAQAAIYRRALIRRHPERDALIHRWTTEICAVPAWASADALVGAVDGSGVSE